MSAAVMSRVALSCDLKLPLALGLLALAGCGGNSYQTQAAARMREICLQNQSWCQDGLIVVKRLPSPATATPLLEIQRFHCDDQSQGQGTSLRVTAHVENVGDGSYDNPHDVTLTATLSDDGQRVLKSATATMGAHTHVIPHSQAPDDPNADIAVPIDFGDVSGTTVREVTVSFDANAWTGIVRLNNGTLSWPAWNNAATVSQTPVDLTATNTCVTQVP